MIASPIYTCVRTFGRAAVLAAGLLVASSVATAAGPEGGRAVDQKDSSHTGDSGPPAKFPISEGMPQVRLPRAQEATLDNGLRLLVLEGLSQIPTFTARIVFTDGGGLHEPPDHRGLASFTADMLREGTATKSAQDVARQLETLGATLEADAPLDASISSITVSGLATHFDPVLALFADTIRNPAFRQQEIAQYASRTIAGLELQRASPEFLAQEQLLRAIYGDHPAALAAPPAAAIKATTAEDLRRFHTAHYRPNAALLVVTGDVTLEEILPKVRNAFGDWKRREAPDTKIPAIPAPRARSVHLVDRPGSVQTVLRLGVAGITRTDPDYFPLAVMNVALGGKYSSRINMNLREKNGYTYGAYSDFTATMIPGVWQITTPVRTGVTAGAMKELIAEMERIRQEPVSATELASAKRALIGTYIFSLERPDRLVDNVITQELYDLPADYWDDYPQKVQAVSVEDVTRVARKIIDLDHLQIAAVGDAAKVREALAEYGPVVGAQAPATDAEAPAANELQGKQRFSAEEKQRFAQTIGRIADKLIASAIDKPTGISWAQLPVEGESLETLNFYDGSPGISYFLLKAYQALGNEKYLEVAEQSMSYILSRGRTDMYGLFFEESANGVFEGNAGPGYLFLYAHHVTGKQQHLDAAEAIARRIIAVPDVGKTSSPDIISGAAGTGLFLLAMYQVTDDSRYLNGARRLGDFLVEHAEARGDGATWKLTGPEQEYYFVGFSHGPVGIAYYLNQLYLATKEQRYLTDVDRAMSHIEAIAIREKNYVKWYHEELKRSTRYSSQWCHGAPGMNPLFLADYARSGEKKSLIWANDSTRYLLDQGVNVRENASVCHGIAGNAASLYTMYAATGNEDYFATIRDAVDLLYGTMKEAPEGVWWDFLGNQADYSYMTGLAGVGDFFTLLYSEGRLRMFGPLGYGDDFTAILENVL